jgi:hypothetical protein
VKACCIKRRGRGKEVASWLVPGGLLVLMPKCPVCFAAYIAAATGLGLSVPAASGLRVSLIILCMLSLAFLAARLLNKTLTKQSHEDP